MLLEHKTSEKPAISQSQTEFQKWHRQLEHAGFTCMRHLKDCVTDINRKLSLTDLEKNCSACLHFKMIWVQGKDSTPRATRRNEWVFSDIWEPYKISTLSENQYFVSFTDKFSCYSTLYLLHWRTDIYNAFEEYRMIAERDTHKSLQFLHTDNAKEYEKLTQKNQNKGIEFKFTTTYISEQNEVSEQLNRIITECIRSLLFNSSLSSEFWEEAAQTACYLRNRLSLGDSHRAKTLYELWTGFKPFIEHLRVFGCVIYTYISSIKWVKLESTSHCEIFVEYCSTSKQFRVYFPILKMVERVSHLIFLENEKGGQLLKNPHQYKKGWESPIDLESMSQLIADADESVRAESSDNTQRSYDSGRLLSQTAGNTEPVRDSTEDPEFHNPRGNFKDINLIESLSSENHRGRSSDSDEVSGTIIVALRPQFQNPMAAESIRSWHDQEIRSSAQYKGASMTQKLIKKPATYKEVMMSSTYSCQWAQAVDEELILLISNSTWEIVNLSNKHQSVISKWVFKIKYISNDLVDCFKACLMTREFSQQYEIDYEEIFISTLHFESLRLLFLIAAIDDLHIY